MTQLIITMVAVTLLYYVVIVMVDRISDLL